MQVTSIPHIRIVTEHDDSLIQPLSGNLLFFHSLPFAYRNMDFHAKTFLIECEEQWVGHISFVVENEEAISLSKSPFGGFGSTKSISENQLIKAIEQIKKELNFISKITVRLFPRIYDASAFDLQKNCLLQTGFKLAYKDTSQYLPITSKCFREVIRHPKQYRHLNYADQPENRFTELDIKWLDEAYAILKDNRVHKGYPMTMEKSDLLATFQRFPDNYFLFGFFIGNELVAASVAIRVNGNILYDFYHGHKASFSNKSPIVPLLAGLYEYARHHGYSVLDLGISTENGIKNPGLFKFKERIGAMQSSKPTFILDLTKGNH